MQQTYKRSILYTYTEEVNKEMCTTSPISFIFSVTCRLTQFTILGRKYNHAQKCSNNSHWISVNLNNLESISSKFFGFAYVDCDFYIQEYSTSKNFLAVV